MPDAGCFYETFKFWMLSGNIRSMIITTAVQYEYTLILPIAYCLLPISYCVPEEVTVESVLFVCGTGGFFFLLLWNNSSRLSNSLRFEILIPERFSFPL